MVRIDGTNFPGLSGAGQSSGAARSEKKIFSVFNPEAKLKEAEKQMAAHVKHDTISLPEDYEKQQVQEKYEKDLKGFKFEALDKEIKELSAPFEEKVLNKEFSYTRILPELSDNNKVTYERGNLLDTGNATVVQVQDTVSVSREEVENYKDAQYLKELRAEREKYLMDIAARAEMGAMGMEKE